MLGKDMTAVSFAQNTRNEVRVIGTDGQVAGTLAAEPGMKQTTYLLITKKNSTWNNNPKEKQSDDCD